MDASPASIHRRFVDEVVVAKRMDLLDELIDPNAVLEQGSLEGLRAQMDAQSKGLDIVVSYLHELTDDAWVVHHMAIEITHSGDFMGQPGSGRVVQMLEVEAARVVDGRIVEMWSVADVFRAMTEIGIALPGPSQPDGGELLPRLINSRLNAREGVAMRTDLSHG
jgi:predicted ester cyclase